MKTSAWMAATAFGVSMLCGQPTFAAQQSAPGTTRPSPGNGSGRPPSKPNPPSTNPPKPNPPGGNPGGGRPPSRPNPPGKPNPPKPNPPRPNPPGGGRPPSRPNPPGKPNPPRPNPPRPNPPRPTPGRPTPGRPGYHPRPPANRPPYHFPGGAGWRLHRYFGPRMAGINRYHRHHFFVGGFFPQIWVGDIQPVPPDVLQYLPPVPPGYAIGYYDGYCIVYDPTTLYILSVVDLFQY